MSEKDMVKVRLTGTMTCNFTRYITMPRDEALELQQNEDDILCNLDSDNSSIEIVDEHVGELVIL